MLARLTARLPAERSERAALGALVLVLVAGLGLRLWLTVSVRPALIGYADSYVYIGAAIGPLFGDPLRPMGYAVFLRWLHDLNANLSFTIVAQHALGLASAVLLYLAARRVGVSRWWSLLPAAVVSLAGPQILIEHAPLTDSLFVFLQAAALYAAARAAGERDWAWALAAGAFAGASATVRALGVFLVGALVLCLLAAPAARWRRRLVRGGAVLLAALVPLGFYVFEQDRQSGYTGLTPAGSWNLYGRVAPFADCDRFDPPEGTRRLCQSKPEDERPGPNSYIFDPRQSPAIKAFGTPFEATQEQSDMVARFARTALVHQPLDLLDHVVTEDFVRYYSADRAARVGAGLGYDGLRETLVSGFQKPYTALRISQYYTTSGELFRAGRFDAFSSYEAATRVSGLVFVVLALLAVAAPFLAPRDLRRGAWLFLAVALIGVLGPLFTLFFDARYAIPAYGPLAAAAAVGGMGITRLVADRTRAGAAPGASSAPISRAPS